MKKNHYLPVLCALFTLLAADAALAAGGKHKHTGNAHANKIHMSKAVKAASRALKGQGSHGFSKQAYGGSRGSSVMVEDNHSSNANIL